MPLLLFIIVGLILMLAGSTWFAGAYTVGLILLIVGVVLLLAALLGGAAVFRGVNRRL